MAGCGRRGQAGTFTETYQLDALNRLQKVTRGSQVTTYEYDATGNVTRWCSRWFA
jgi:YD repeat-containing protein